MSSKMFFGGVPTDGDVERLVRELGTLAHGDSVSHERVAEIIGAPHDSSRYRTVTSAWRRRMLRESNLEISCVAGEGFKVLTPSERVSSSIKQFDGGARKIGRSIRNAATIQRAALSQEDASKADHFVRLGQKVLQVASEVKREIALPTFEQSPRRLSG